MIVNRTPGLTYKTYEIMSPLPTHFRPATCREIECAGYVNGWKTTVLPGTPEHAQVLALKGRYSFTGPVRNADGTETFDFSAGQQCFRRSQHRIPVGREPLYVVRDKHADTRVRQYRTEDWVDDFANHQQGIADRVKRG